jgi:SAM-dependent methyltransferase
MADAPGHRAILASVPAFESPNRLQPRHGRRSVIDPQYERETLEVEGSHWWYSGRRRIVRDVVRSLPLPGGASILDAGCGSGRNVVEMAPFGEVTGLESSPISLEVARSRGGGKIVEGSIETMPFRDGSFDLATCLDVIEHIEEDGSALRELRRVVRSGGFLLVTVPAYPWLWSSHDLINGHHRRYTRKTLLGVARDAGWEPCRTTHFNALLLPAAVAYRSVERVRRSERAEVSELVLTFTPQWLNWLLKWPLRAEASLLATGRRIPAGLSLLSVFRTRAPGRVDAG